MALTEKQQHLAIGGAALVVIIALIAYFGRSKSQSQTPTGVDPGILQAVLNASVAENTNATQLQETQVSAAAGTLATLRGYEAAVAQGQLTLEQAQAGYAAAVQEAQINAGVQNTAIAANLRSTTHGQAVQLALGEQATSAAQSEAGIAAKTSFWNSLFASLSSSASALLSLFTGAGSTAGVTSAVAASTGL